MECSQDLLQLDNEISRTNFERDSDPFLPVIPLSKISEELLENGLNRPPVTPLHLPHGFIKEERWLFSPPPVVPTSSIHFEVKPSLQVLNETLDRLNPTPHVTVKEEKIEAVKRRSPHSKSLHISSEKPPRKRIQSNTILPVGLGPIVWCPPSSMQIISHSIPDLVKRLTTSCMPYVIPSGSQISRK